MAVGFWPKFRHDNQNTGRLGGGIGLAEQPGRDRPIAKPALSAMPDPFSSRMMLSYTLSSTQAVSLRIYDVTGRPVRTLVAGRQEAGKHTIVWDGTDESRLPIAKGVYLCRLETEGHSTGRRLTRLE